MGIVQQRWLFKFEFSRHARELLERRSFGWANETSSRTRRRIRQRFWRLECARLDRVGDQHGHFRSHRTSLAREEVRGWFWWWYRKHTASSRVKFTELAFERVSITARTQWTSLRDGATVLERSWRVHESFKPSETNQSRVAFTKV